MLCHWLYHITSIDLFDGRLFRAGVAAMLSRATRAAPSASTNLPFPLFSSFFKFIGLFLSLLHETYTCFRQFH